MNFLKYEAEKKKLQEMNLTQSEYEEEIKRIVEKLESEAGITPAVVDRDIQRYQPIIIITYFIHFSILSINDRQIKKKEGKMEKNYVAHDCRNSRNSETLPKKARNGKIVYVPNTEYCNNRWVDVDKTGAKTQIPNWKYCRECCEKMGINFEKQKPSDYRTDERNEQIKKNIERLREARNKNINSDIV